MGRFKPTTNLNNLLIYWHLFKARVRRLLKLKASGVSAGVEERSSKEQSCNSKLARTEGLLPLQEYQNEDRPG